MSYSQAVVGSVGWLTMNRPAAMTGNGRAFCAGTDLIEAAEPPQPDKREFLELIVDFFDTLRAFPKPVIAAVNGLALAGGLEIVLACDIVLAAESVRLGDAHSNFGVFPGAGGAAVLPRKVPANVARYLLFTGDYMNAAELKGYGLRPRQRGACRCRT